MNKEELKEKYSMTDILSRYGMHPNRAGFVRCPFHTGDHTASLKVYKDSFYCFGCNATGDIFGFVQLMEKVDFKEAFQILGGTYEKPTFSSRLAVYRSEARKKQIEKENQQKKKERDLNNLLIDVYRKWMNKSEPLSDVWCSCYNALQYQLYIHEIINDMN